MEISREPDVYVKTVLTFGDKPAPAMVQTALQKTALQKTALQKTALQKTAGEGEKCYPKAAKVLKKNTYMDDICD